MRLSLSIIFYLFAAVPLIVIALLIMIFDEDLSRSWNVVGGILNVVGAYWIAAGVVLRKQDLVNQQKILAEAEGSTTSDKQSIGEFISRMLKTQSRRAEWGVFVILVGTLSQILSQYAG